MPKDHYVSQVHLRNFYADKLGRKKMYCTRKENGATFICGSEDVCHSMDGSNNEHFSDSRLIEKLLKIIEPAYNRSVDEFRRGYINSDAAYCFAAFAASIVIFSPTGLRTNKNPLRQSVISSTRIMEKAGKIPPMPAELYEALGTKSIGDLIDHGTIKVDVDEKYAQALMLQNILYTTCSWTNSYWDIIINNEKNSQFFTSDYPVGIISNENGAPVKRLIPIAPDIAVIISPIVQDVDINDHKYPGFMYKIIEGNKQKINYINKIIVQSAEDKVFYSKNDDWIPSFIKKYADFRVFSLVDELPVEGGYMNISRLRIKKKQPSDI